MRLSIGVMLLVASLGIARSGEAAGSIAQETKPAEAALARLRALAGEWQGTFEWTGEGHGNGTIGASYYLTGRDSAVIENLTMDGIPTMTSAYHLDNGDLRVTHYCAAQNQPRLKAERLDLAGGAIDFALVDVTNLASPDAGHVESIALRLLDDQHLTITFGFVAGPKTSQEHISLERVSRKPL